MKNYYMIKTETLHGPTPEEFHFTKGFHWVNLDNGYSIVVANFDDEAAEARFSQHEAVEALPHLLSNDTISADHHEKLKDFFPNIKPTHRTFDIAQEIAKHHVMFSPRVY